LFLPDVSAGEGEEVYRQKHKSLYDLGFRTTGAFPFFVDGQEGVLYLHFKQLHKIAPDEEEWINLFVNKATNAIRHTISLSRLRDTENQLTTLNLVFQSLVRSTDSSAVVREIAWSTLNMLASDLVSIYEYHPAEGERLGPPVRAGRLIVSDLVETPDTPEAIPLLNYFDIDSKIARKSFVERERIASSCAVLLRAGTDTVGVMFVSYRRTHEFLDEEKRASFDACLLRSDCSSKPQSHVGFDRCGQKCLRYTRFQSTS
jgi:hypothetical protein